MFRGKVIRGDGVGKQLGYPTANLDTRAHDVNVKTGVYAVYATCINHKYPAALVIQENPWKVEVHLLEYDGADCYGRVIEVNFVQKVSEIERHDSDEELQAKIKNDLALVKRVLNID